MKTLLLLLGLLSGAAVAAAQTGPNAVAGNAFVPGAQDQIEVDIASYPDLRTTARIAPNGTVVLPLVGSAAIAGKTPAMAAKTIEALLTSGGYIKLPINNQGLVVLDRDYSVAEILAKAGGPNPDAADTAVIMRQLPAGGSERITGDIGNFGSRSKVKIRRTPADGGTVVTLNARIDDPLRPGDVMTVGERVF